MHSRCMNANECICYVKVIEIVNEREEIEAQQVLRESYDCVLKLN